jgi:hypothetical protein
MTRLMADVPSDEIKPSFQELRKQYNPQFLDSSIRTNPLKKKK